MLPPKTCPLLLFVYLIAGAILAPVAPAQSTPPQTKAPVVAPLPTKQWTGDFDVLLKHRVIRIGVPYSKTLFYTVKGAPNGASYEMGKEFEKYLNKKYPLQNKNLKIHVLLTITPREKAAASLTSGKFDILIGAITITSERQKLADFSDPLFTDVKEIVVTAPNSAQIASLDGLTLSVVVVRGPARVAHDALRFLNSRQPQHHSPRYSAKFLL